MTNSSDKFSRIPGMRGLSVKARLSKIAKAASLTTKHSISLSGNNVLADYIADGMIENVIGKFEIPLGVATNFTINQKDYLIPMAIEEPSVIAAASNMAGLARKVGGFKAQASKPIMRAQIQILGLSDPYAALHRVMLARGELIAEANACDTLLVGLGGGCSDIEGHVFTESSIGSMLVLHLLVDVRDAMGANTVNTMAEALAPKIGTITGGEVRLKILSNLADLRLVRASVDLPSRLFKTDILSGNEVCKRILECCELALIDPYRAATHNKGIMNGIDPIVLATGNDWRAIEAGAHAYAARSGHYSSLSRWELSSEGLAGTIELPMAVGLVGGATKTHPTAQAAIKLLNVTSAGELAEVIAAVGLAQNLGALRALATEGIQRGHMALHARNIAIAAGASGRKIETIANTMVKEGTVSVDRARTLLDET